MPESRKDELAVALIGAGAFGARRAAAVAGSGRSSLVVVADSAVQRAGELADSVGALALPDWRAAIECTDVGAVIISTPTRLAPKIALAALAAGKHVLAEKPFGRAAREIESAIELAAERQLVLKVGYNHRYHPAIAKAHELVAQGVIGRPLFLRCVYGHGGRPGYEKEWRSRPEISGGGQLLDQGVHALDLFRWFAGEFAEASALLSTSFWPVAPVEDNVFAMLRTRDGVVAQLHASWTQWKNTFSLEIVGESGSLGVTGLGRSYGPERLVQHTRPELGGPPEEDHLALPPDCDSLALEWNDFLDAVERGGEPMSSGADAWRTLRLVDALYRSAREGRVVRLEPAAEFASGCRAERVVVQ